MSFGVGDLFDVVPNIISDIPSEIDGILDDGKEALKFGKNVYSDIEEILSNFLEINSQVLDASSTLQKYFEPVLTSSTLLLVVGAGIVLISIFCSVILAIALIYIFVGVQSNYKSISKNADFLYSVYF